MKPNGLLDRIQQLASPDRQIDGLIYRIVHNVPEWRRGPTVIGHVEGENGAIIDVPAYTASIDAAASLVPVRHLWTMDSWSGPKWSAGIWHEGKRQFVVYSSESHSQRSPAIALCAAALRVTALSLSDTDPHGDGKCGCTERCKDRDDCQYDGPNGGRS